jgi:multidrug resistance efflux pump
VPLRRTEFPPSMMLLISAATLAWNAAPGLFTGWLAWAVARVVQDTDDFTFGQNIVIVQGKQQGFTDRQGRSA